jgi:hypothetical protein
MGARPAPGFDVYVALMQRCWAQAPDQRPGFDEIETTLEGISKGLARAANASHESGST